jgi:cytochrome c-type biogenesis protein
MLESRFLEHLESTFDDEYGGFLQGGREQKFPAGMAYKYLLEKYEETNRPHYLEMVQKTFDNQYTEITELEKGYHLYDPVEGGFHRYSTKRDWSIPHYEKMLGDEAKILRAYAHLLKMTNDTRVRNAVEGTISFVLEKFYDKRGGFYSSQDAYLEDKYYGLNEDERKKIAPPYIDKTRIIDANAMMTGTFLYLYESLGNKDYMAVAEKSLDFLQKNMVGNNGAYYYFDFDKNEPFLTGQTISNAWALLVFIDGYSVLGDKLYLSTAKHIAEYSLKNLYDWNSGVFFERNSKDDKHYAPAEQLDLSKPYQENAVYTYAMLRLHLLTEDLKYLEAGLKTLGHLLSNRPGGLDDIYYALKAAKLAGDNDLLNVYKNKRGKLDSILEQGKSDFFLSKQFAEQQEPNSVQDPPELAGGFTGEGFMVLSILAFLTGVLSFLSPCTLPILPAYFAQGFHAGRGEILKNTVFFFLGLATVFSLFGMGATLIGNIMRDHRQVFTQTAAVVIIIFGILEIFGKGFSGLNVYLKGSRRTPVGSYLFGSVFAVGWSACIGPILASFLLLSAASGTMLKGTSLLFIYAVGLAVPLMLVSLYFDRVRSNKFWKILQGRELSLHVFKQRISVHSMYLISGLILIALGVMIFNDYLFKLNKLTFQTDYVQDIIVSGEEFLKGLFLQ